MVFRRSRRQDRVQQALTAAVYQGDRRARGRVERWWAAGGDDREKVWRGAWFLLSAASFRFGNHEQPARVAPVLEFLLEPDPTSSYRPRVRLTACLPMTAEDPPSGVYHGDPDVQHIVEAALGFPDEGLRRRLADLLAETDQPGLLDALEAAVRPYARPGPRFVGTAPAGRDARQDMWLGEQGALLRIVFANPGLPRPPADPGDVDLALLAVLKQRPDLLPAFDQAALAGRLVDYAGTDLPEDVAAAVRRSLRNLGAGSGDSLQDLRRRWMRRALLDRAARLEPEAVAAVVDAGYLPEDDELALLPLLFLTEQFDRYDQEDPDGTKLRAALAERRHRYEHEHFRTVAERSGRDDPWPPYEPPPQRYRSGVHATTWPSSLGGGGHSIGGYF